MQGRGLSECYVNVIKLQISVKVSLIRPFGQFVPVPEIKSPLREMLISSMFVAFKAILHKAGASKPIVSVRS